MRPALPSRSSLPSYRRPSAWLAGLGSWIWRRAVLSPPWWHRAPFATAQASFGRVVVGAYGELQPRRRSSGRVEGWPWDLKGRGEAAVAGRQVRRRALITVSP